MSALVDIFSLITTKKFALIWSGNETLTNYKTLLG